MKNKLLPLVFSCLALPTLADSISIRADKWYPMNGSPNSAQQGYMIDIAQQIFNANGYELDYQVMPWQRSVMEVEQGLHDCVVGAYVEDAPTFTFPKESWGLVTTGIFVNINDKFTYENLTSLDNRKVGIISGYAYSSEAINEKIEKQPEVFKPVTGADALTLNIRKLQHGRIDTIVENPAVMNAKLAELGIADQIKLAGHVGTQSPIYIACTPDSERAKKIADMVDEGTKALRASGKLDEILKKYGLSDWAE